MEEETKSKENETDSSDRESNVVSTKQVEKEPPKAKNTLAADDAKMVAVISIFLNDHLIGARSQDIWSHLLDVIDASVTFNDVEELMEKYPTCFTKEVEGILAGTWKLAFKPC